MNKDWQRAVMVAFPENITSNCHYHIYGRLPAAAYKFTPIALETLLAKHWCSIIRTGTTDCQEISGTKSHLLGYSTKQFNRRDVREGIVMSTMFWSS